MVPIAAFTKCSCFIVQNSLASAHSVYVLPFHINDPNLFLIFSGFLLNFLPSVGILQPPISGDLTILSSLRYLLVGFLFVFLLKKKKK